MKHSFESLPRRIFLDSCTAQTLRQYGGYIYEGEPIPDSDRIHRVPEGIANVEALRNIFLVNERAQFEWIVSRASMREAYDKGEPGHMQWLRDIAVQRDNQDENRPTIRMRMCRRGDDEGRA
ncbi:MAG: hypothetical protein ACLPX9_01565 [Rhodomicrobium sp.]